MWSTLRALARLCKARPGAGRNPSQGVEEVRFEGLHWRDFWVIVTTPSPVTRVATHCEGNRR
jgi:hypothetical protein